MENGKALGAKVVYQQIRGARLGDLKFEFGSIDGLLSHDCPDSVAWSSQKALCPKKNKCVGH